MAVTFVAANAAYQAASRMAAGAPAAASATVPAQGGSFENALGDAVKNAMNTMRTGETAAGAGVTGQGDVVQMVNAVTNAELTLQTVVAIRDKVISAYQDILKMPI
jgi:flagellar hook-basal body complex protein FliE